MSSCILQPFLCNGTFWNAWRIKMSFIYLPFTLCMFQELTKQCNYLPKGITGLPSLQRGERVLFNCGSLVLSQLQIVELMNSGVRCVLKREGWGGRDKDFASVLVLIFMQCYSDFQTCFSCYPICGRHKWRSTTFQLVSKSAVTIIALTCKVAWRINLPE